MSEVRSIIEALVERGVDPIDAAEIVTRAAIHGAASVPKQRSAGATRQERYRRNKASQVTESDASVQDGQKGPQTPKKDCPPTPPKGGSSPRASRIDPDWKPSKADAEYAAGKGLTDTEIAREAETFRDWWLQQPDSKARKLDWAATWRTWIQRTAKDKPQIVDRLPGDLPSCKPYSGEWFAILIEKIRKGDNVGAFMQRARDGTAWTYRPEDLPNIEGWIAYAAPTAQQDASEGFHRWGDWFAEHGARLPDRVRVLTVPAEFPPANERAA